MHISFATPKNLTKVYCSLGNAVQKVNWKECESWKQSLQMKLPISYAYIFSKSTVLYSITEFVAGIIKKHQHKSFWYLGTVCF